MLDEQQIAPATTIGSNDLFYLFRRSRLVRICGVVYFRSLGCTPIYVDITIYECT